MALYFYFYLRKIISFFYVHLHIFHNKIKKNKKKKYENENIFFKRNMLILIDISKIAYFSRYYKG